VTTTITYVLITVVSVFTALGVAWAVFRSTARVQTIGLFEKENDALTKALARQESENLRLQTKVDALANANAVLQETVSGTLAVKELAKEIQREEGQRREEHQTQIVLLKDIIAELRQARGALGR
jgi:hypothetical protein